MRWLVLASALYAGCASHPLASAISIGGGMAVGGTVLAADGHQLAGGIAIGLAISTLLVAVPIAVIIDNFNEAHRGY